MKIEYLLYIGLFILIGISIVLVITIKQEGNKCMNDPFGYTLDILERQTTSEVMCTCFSDNKRIVLSRNGSTDISSQFPKSNEIINISSDLLNLK